MKRPLHSLLTLLALTSLACLTLAAPPAEPKAPTAPAAPEGFESKIFAKPPEVNYPVNISASITGELYIAVDAEGSLGKAPGHGKVVRATDTDGDGVADKFTTFAVMDHPRGVIYDHNTLWVQHPPTLTVYFDDNNDGVSDRSTTLVTGISTKQNEMRGADHTTNGIRMGIDGWIYVAVGDFGMVDATGTDGKKLTLHGGGIVRVRPDGTELELFESFNRNMCDLAIDPFLNIFTRDNTNDGGGWNIRVAHNIQTANYGYPSLFQHFSEEIMPPLADYGGGSGTGALFVHEPGFPKPFDNILLTCDWGRSIIYSHELKPVGATFGPEQKEFIRVPKPTDVDVDGQSNLYIASWENGKFSYSGPNVGFIAKLSPKGYKPEPTPNLDKATDVELVKYVGARSAVLRLAAQRELLRRKPSDAANAALVALASDSSAELYARVAAIFTYKQILGEKSTPALAKLASDSAVREFALRAMTDRLTQLAGVPRDLYIAALKDPNPRVQVAALVGLNRLHDTAAAPQIIPLAHLSATPQKYGLTGPGVDHVVPHIAVQTLAAIGGGQACLDALETPNRDGALWALKKIHDPAVATGLIEKLKSKAVCDDAELKKGVLTTLIRMYNTEAPYTDGSQWWGTRPDTSGPYFKRVTWAGSESIGAAIIAAFDTGDAATQAHIAEEVNHVHAVIPGLKVAAPVVAKADEKPAVDLTQVNKQPGGPGTIGAMPFEKAVAAVLAVKKADAKIGEQLFTKQGCVVCHTTKDGQTPKGPHLANIGKRYKNAELLESILKPSEKIAQGFETHLVTLKDNSTLVGFIVNEGAETLDVRDITGKSTTVQIDKIKSRTALKNSIMPEGLAAALTPQQLAAILAYLDSL